MSMSKNTTQTTHEILRSAYTTLAVAFTTVLCFVAGTEQTFAQSGGAAVPFITIGTDSRANGMGDAATGLADDINAMHWNPGGMGFQFDRQVTLNYSRWLPQFNADLFYSHAAYSQYVDAVQGTIGASFILMNLGEFHRTDISGRELGVFRSNEFAVNICYATLVGEDVGIGINLKYIQSNLGASAGTEGGGTGVSGAADIGVLWRPSKLKIAGFDLSDRFSVGLNLRNLGPSMTYNQFSDPLPQTIRIGLAATVLRDEFNDLTFTTDWSKLLIKRYDDGSFDKFPQSVVTGFSRSGSEFAVGMEYWYDKIVALRGGYFTEPTSVGGRQYFTIGLGVHFDIFYPNFSFIIPIEQNHPLANTARFSLVVNWGNITSAQKNAPKTN